MPQDNFRSKNLNLPFIAPAQAMKHVTVNEAVRALDALVQLSVIARDVAGPPLAPVEGARFLVPSAPTGDWAGQGGNLAAWQDGAWSYFVPQPGWRVWCEAEAVLLVFNTTGWELIGGEGASQNLSGLGIGTASDTVNRLSVISPAALFSHAGSDQRIILNKAVKTDTSSLMYQTGFSGRAEMGLMGGDDFHLKVSPDGTAWSEAFTVDASTGLCRTEKVAFDAKLSTNQTGVAANTETLLNFDNALLNKGGYFDVTTGRFTPPAGLYSLSVMMIYIGAQDNERGAALIRKNGVQVKSHYRAAAGTQNTSLSVSGIFEANGTDYFEAAVLIAGSGTKTIFNLAQYTHFQGHAL